MSLNTACGLAAILLAIFMREKLRRANKKLDVAEEAVTIGMQERGSSDEEEKRATTRMFRYVT